MIKLKGDIWLICNICILYQESLNFICLQMWLSNMVTREHGECSQQNVEM